MHDPRLRRIKMLRMAAVIAMVLVGLGFYLRHEKAVAKTVDLFGSPFADIPAVGKSAYTVKTELDAPPYSFAETAEPPLLLPVEPGATTDTVPILLYHGIVRRRDRFNVTIDTFRQQLAALRRNGYRSITLKQYLEWKAGAPLPARSFLLTFDDGRRDSWIQADPVLKELGFTALMFIATESSLHPLTDKKSTYYVEKDEIKAMVASGRWEIGSHAQQLGAGYVYVDGTGQQGQFLSNKAYFRKEDRLESDEEWAARLKLELGESRNILENVIGEKVESFAYPFGDYGQMKGNVDHAEDAVRAVISKTYATAFRQVWPGDGELTENLRGGDPYTSKRFEVPTDWTGERLVKFLQASEPKKLPYKITRFESETGWIHQTGDLRAHDGVLTFSSAVADDSETGETILDGTALWSDYEVRASSHWNAGERLVIMVRYQDPENYANCIYGGGRVRVESHVNGERVYVADVKAEGSEAPNSPDIGATVFGNQVACFLNGATVIAGETTVPAGGIGLRIWDPEVGKATVDLKNISVRVAKSLSL